MDGHMQQSTQQRQNIKHQLANNKNKNKTFEEYLCSP